MTLTAKEAAARWRERLTADNRLRSPVRSAEPSGDGDYHVSPAPSAADAVRLAERRGYVAACIDIYGKPFEDEMVKIIEEYFGLRREQETSE